MQRRIRNHSPGVFMLGPGEPGARDFFLNPITVTVRKDSLKGYKDGLTASETYKPAAPIK